MFLDPLCDGVWVDQETEFDVSFLSRAFKVSAVCEAI